MKIPDNYHFIFLTANSEKKPREFSLINYLAIAACEAVNKPAKITIYYDNEPSGIWWSRAKPYLNCVRVTTPRAVFGNPVKHLCHVADIMRLDILMEEGGIYLDLDVICLRPLADLRDCEVVLGEERNVGLCNAVILARPGARFLRRWLGAYRWFSNEDWNTHSVKVPRELAKQFPDEIRVLDHRKFYWPMWYPKHLRTFCLGTGSRFSEQAYCVHLWESVPWGYLKEMTAQRIWLGKSEFCGLAKQYIDPAWIADTTARIENLRTHSIRDQ